jgi:ABC-type nitrate/sulfonate/bicarbonate transport system ATPase subunit
MIQVDSLKYTYQEGPPVFDGFDWAVEHGDSWVILGPSGCGKTTLLYLIAGLLFPRSGTIKIDGESLVRPRPQTGLILQDYGLLPWSTVRQNVELGLNIRTFYGPDGKHAPKNGQQPDNVNHWLDRLELTSQENKFPGQLSGGQRQRAAIARTLVLKPDLLLMDEPFSSLDAPTREGLQQLTLELVQEEKITLILVTHSIEEAAFVGKKILLLTKPPNNQAVILENFSSGREGFRDTDEYQRLCRELRKRMDEI